MSEHTTRITSSAIAIPFQFLCGGLSLPSSWREGEKQYFKIHTKQYEIQL